MPEMWDHLAGAVGSRGLWPEKPRSPTGHHSGGQQEGGSAVAGSQTWRGAEHGAGDTQPGTAVSQEHCPLQPSPFSRGPLLGRQLLPGPAAGAPRCTPGPAHRLGALHARPMLPLWAPPAPKMLTALHPTSLRHRQRAHTILCGVTLPCAVGHFLVTVKDQQTERQETAKGQDRHWPPGEWRPSCHSPQELPAPLLSLSVLCHHACSAEDSLLAAPGALEVGRRALAHSWQMGRDSQERRVPQSPARPPSQRHPQTAKTHQAPMASEHQALGAL